MKQHRQSTIARASTAALLATLLTGPPLLAQELVGPTPIIAVGDPNGTPPTSPGAHLDPNVLSSPYAGVVSLLITANGNEFLCSGTLISPTAILTAGHCIDLNDDGTVDVLPSSITVNFNHNNSTNDQAGATQIGASLVTAHPDYEGFDSGSFNDDLAIIKLDAPAPIDVPFYGLSTTQPTGSEHLYLAGYGDRGTATGGYVNGSGDYYRKRIGENVTDTYDTDDEGSGSLEIFHIDFDGPTASTNTLNDGLTLGNDLEVTLGTGDSGGPSFTWDDTNTDGQITQDELTLFGVNTFIQGVQSGPNVYNPPEFGSQAGGIVVASYDQWIQDNDGIDEDGSWAMTGGGLWQRETDWSGSVPDGIDSDAVFGPDGPVGTALVRVGEGGIMLGSIAVQTTNRINIADLATNGIDDLIYFRTTSGNATISVIDEGFLSIDNDIVLQSDLVLDVTGNLALRRNLSGQNSITANSAGVMTFDGALTHTGNTFINAGIYIVNGTHTGGARYEINGTVANSVGTTLSGSGSIDASIRVFKGVIIAGDVNDSVGTLEIGDGLFGGGTHYRWRIADSGADKLVVDGDLDLNGGVFRFVRFNNFDPTVGDSWVAIESLGGTINGTFASVQGRLLGDKDIELTYTANQLIVTVVSTAPPAASLQAFAVPEPSSLSILAIGGFALMRRRRR